MKLTFLGELRYDLLSRWLADAYLSVFYTTGGTSEQSDPLPESHTYQHGVGAAFSANTFLGPMSVTYGELLKSYYSTGHGIVYLNLGHNF